MATEQQAQRIRQCVDEVVLAARSDPAMAAELVREIETIAGDNPEPLFEAYSHRANGHLLHISGRMPEAVERYRAALALFKQCNEEVERARTASTLVGALVPLGEFEEALHLADEAREIYQQSNLQLRAARLDVNVGNLYHRLNRLEDALSRYERAAPFLETSNDHEAAAGVLINRSVMLMLLYRFDEAHESFLRARTFSQQHGLAVFATQSEYNRAYLLFLIGNYGEALKLMQAAETGFRELGDQIHVAHCRLDRAEIFLELNLPEHAYDLAGQAEEGFRSSGLNGDRARALLLLGRSLMRLGHADEAGAQCKKAVELFHGEGNPIWAAMAELEIAAALMSRADDPEAINLADQAGELFRSQNNVPFSALADALCARFYIARREPDRALRYLHRCEASLKSQPPACLRYHTEYLKGRALEQEDRKSEARICFSRAAESLEFLLTHISVDHAMVRFLEDKEDVYERLAGLSEDVREALMLADRARARASISTRDLRHRSTGISDKVRALREGLRSDHLRLFQSNQTDPDGLFETIQRSERRLTQELLEEQMSRPAREPDSHWKPEGRFPEALDILDDEVVLEYFLIDDSVSVFVAGKGRMERVPLPITVSELQQEVNFTRYGLSVPGNARREAALRHHLRRLHEALIEPVNHLLAERIVIVPHRFLHHLPFHLLVGPAGYLTDRHVISYAPSLAAYALACRRESRSAGTSVIIGAEASDLPGVSCEIREVAARLPNCTIAVNQRVPELLSAFKTAAFIHIASHGLFRADNPSWSLLDLGGDVLAPADVLDFEVNAQLITMSACSTGKTQIRGNEVQGFVRAFSLWGVPSVIGSLWEVNDHATSALMSSFYGRIRDSADIAQNLRCAMQDVRREFEHPYYWGGFVLIGRQKLKPH